MYLLATKKSNSTEEETEKKKEEEKEVEEGGNMTSMQLCNPMHNKVQCSLCVGGLLYSISLTLSKNSATVALLLARTSRENISLILASMS